MDSYRNCTINILICQHTCTITTYIRHPQKKQITHNILYHTTTHTILQSPIHINKLEYRKSFSIAFVCTMYMFKTFETFHTFKYREYIQLQSHGAFFFSCSLPLLYSQVNNVLCNNRKRNVFASGSLGGYGCCYYYCLATVMLLLCTTSPNEPAKNNNNNKNIKKKVCRANFVQFENYENYVQFSFISCKHGLSKINDFFVVGTFVLCTCTCVQWIYVRSA